MNRTRALLALVIAALIALPLVGADEDKPDNNAKRKAAAMMEAKLLEAVAKSRMSLAQAITRAEAQLEAKALSAACKMEKEELVIHVQLLADGKKHQVMVNAATGEVTRKDKPDRKRNQDKPRQNKQKDRGNDESEAEDDEQSMYGNDDGEDDMDY